jgi:non-specific serine/threonine protein kinase
MGLGKTVIADSLIKAYHNKLTPILIVCKSSLTIQWLMETFKWAGRMACIIENGKEKPDFSFFQIFICSMDLLRRSKWADDEETTFKTIIIDEVQHIKNPGAQRTQLIRKLCSKADNVIGLSGTPIKNHAAEYFTILNILYPHLFPQESGFLSQWVQSYWDSDAMKFRHGGIKHWKRFQEITGDFILRFTREEVMPEIPKVQRTFMFCDLGDELHKMYDESLDKFRQAYDDKMLGENKWEAGAALQESMNEMRQVIGLAKVKPTVEYVEEFLETWRNGTSRKIVVFAHHIRAADMLEDALNEIMPTFDALPVLRMKGGMKAKDNYELEQEFKTNPHRRVLVASTLAAGEGKNFQFCSDAVLMERQWNPANEEQAEARFTRIGSEADFVGVKYIVARGTFDEVMAKLVEKKRQYVTQALSGKDNKWQESDFMSELMKLIYEGKKAA